MCIIFLARECLSKCAGGHLKLVHSLGTNLEIGRCVDPTSFSPIHCSKLEVRHKGEWYERCASCTDLAERWRDRKENECADMDKAEAAKIEKRRSFEMEIVRKEEEVVKKSHSQVTEEDGIYTGWTGRCCALST